jgi:LysR family transcriptional regulator, glycine cleavage system transcriptional activator
MLDPSRLPSLTSIRAFEAVARLGGFARAARELGTTGASVSYHVRQIERQTGIVMFHRHPHRVELTQAGALIAEETVKAFDALRASFARGAALEDAHLHMTALPTFGSSWLAPRLGGFRALHPEIQLEVDLSAAAQNLAAGRFDVAIRNGHGRWPGLRAVPLFPSLFMPLCAPELLAAAAGLTGPIEALEAPLLGRPDWWAIWFRAIGHRDPPPPEYFGIRLAEERLDATAAIAGHGITIGSPILFQGELDADRLVPAHPLVAGDGRGFWLAYPLTRQHSAKIALFRQWLCEQADQAREAAKAWIAGAVVETAPAI